MKRSSLLTCLFFLLLLVMAGIPTAAAATPTITGVSPSTGPNNGVVTVTITGTNFDRDLVKQVTMNKCGKNSPGGGEAMFPGTFSVISSTKITATFDLTGKKAGDYDVWVNAPNPPLIPEDWGQGVRLFQVYQYSGSTPTATHTTTTKETVATTATTVSTGDNSVFFETDPSGATIFLNGDEVGTSTFTYYTYKDGVFDVLVKKIGYEDYSDRVTIIEGQRVRFYAQLTPLGSAGTTSGTTPVTTTASRTPLKTVTTIKKSTIKVPTPWGTDPPVTEESPVDPALALAGAGIAIGFVLIRRR